MSTRRVLRFARHAFPVAVFAGALLLLPGMASADQRLQEPSLGARPSGLVAVIINVPGQPLDLAPFSNPSISGVALQIHWSDIEPVQGEPDWTQLDALLAAAKSSHKWVQLLIFPGFFSPAWALQGAQTDQFPLQYGPGKGTVATLPMPWDPVYLGNWSAFVKLLSSRYGGNTSLKVIAAAGPTSVSAEFTLPETPSDLTKWRSDGYTPAKYIGAWQQVCQTYATDFPNQYVSLSLGSGLRINNLGKPGPRQPMLTRSAVVDQAKSILGSRFVLQGSNLDGVPSTAYARSTVFVISYNGSAVTGFQLRTSCVHNSANMGAAGNPPLALTQSIDNGLEPDQAGGHVDYIEVYSPDVESPEMQTALKSAAARFLPVVPRKPIVQHKPKYSYY